MADDEIRFASRRFQIVRRTYQTPDGAQHDRDLILHPGAVTILPLVNADTVCLIRNYRVAVGQTLLELPAGTLEPGEDPSHTARRELEEETGFRAARLEHLHDFWMSPGILCERMHLFVASGLSAGATHFDQGEQIENLIVPWSDALDMVRQGHIQDAKTLIGLLYYDRWKRGQPAD